MRRDVKDKNPPNGPLWGKGQLKDCSWCGAGFVIAGSFLVCPTCDVGSP